MPPFSKRLKHAWNAFATPAEQRKREPFTEYYGGSYGSRPDRVRLNFSNERSIISSIYTRLSMDIASIAIRHVRTDDARRYIEDIDSGLNNCLTLEANIDQGGRQFRQDIAMTLFDEGVAVLVPVDTSINPASSGGFDIKTMRVGRAITWYPRHVRVSVYNDTTGNREELTLLKNTVAIVENPLYSVMNEQNSTLKRLIHKLNLLDAVDEQSASGKLDLIIQLPYVIKSEARRLQAEQRRKDIEFQLKGSQYGIAYTDGTEKITQLNRPAENNLMAQIEYLTTMLYNELGLTNEVMDGTADEKTMLNYMNRTIEPVLDAITEAICRSFLTKTARSQLQWIMYFKDPFKLVPLADLAAAIDILSRNEIVSPNEVRGFMGIAPADDPKANELNNSNMPQPDAAPTDAPADTATMASSFDDIDSALDDALSQLGDDGSDDATA